MTTRPTDGSVDVPVDQVDERPGSELMLVDEPGELVPTDGPATGSTAAEVVDVAELVDVDGTADRDELVVIEGRVIEPAAAVWALPPAGRPILPLWLTDRATFVAAVRWAARRGAHLAGFHAVRVPLYGARLAGRAPVGTGRLVTVWSTWVSDETGRTVRRSLSTGPGITPESFYRVTEQHKQTVKARMITTAVATAGLAGANWAVLTLAPAPVITIIGVVVALVVGWMGRSPAHPVLSRSTDQASAPKITTDLVINALSTLGIGELNRALRLNPACVQFVTPPHRDGPGWRTDLDLPAGVTAADVVERRNPLASGLRRPMSAVWPEPDQGVHAARLMLWVGDRTMAASKPTPWPLLERGAVDLFAPFPIGVDPRGRVVTVTLMFASVVIAAQPRMGKSFTLRLLLLAAALDPTVRLCIFDCKGGADLNPVGPVAHRFRSGASTDDIAYLVACVQELVVDMDRRYAVIRDLPLEVCPESKVTRELANRPELGLCPVVLVIDECQLAFEHPIHGKEIEELVTDLVKRGPAAGIVVVCATQRPDAKSLPTGISANAILRLSGRVAGQVETDITLGTSSYKAGLRPSDFTRSDKGIVWLVGEGDEPTIVQTAFINAVHAVPIAARARAARQAAGLLTGYAAGLNETPEADTTSLLDHLVRVWPAEQTGPAGAVWWEDLATRLAELFPGTYDGWGAGQVSAAGKAYNLRSTQIKRTLDGRPVNRRGLLRTDLDAALGARRQPDEPDHPKRLDQGEGWPQLPPASELDDHDDQDNDDASGAGGGDR